MVDEILSGISNRKVYTDVRVHKKNQPSEHYTRSYRTRSTALTENSDSSSMDSILENNIIEITEVEDLEEIEDNKPHTSKPVNLIRNYIAVIRPRKRKIRSKSASRYRKRFLDQDEDNVEDMIIIPKKLTRSSLTPKKVKRRSKSCKPKRSKRRSNSCINQMKLRSRSRNKKPSLFQKDENISISVKIEVEKFKRGRVPTRAYVKQDNLINTPMMTRSTKSAFLSGMKSTFSEASTKASIPSDTK